MDGTTLNGAAALNGTFTITVTGSSLADMLRQLKLWVQVIEAAQAGGTPNGLDDAPAPLSPPTAQEPPPAPSPAGTRRRRGREAEAAAAPAVDEIPSRAEIMSLLQKCWGPAPEKVVEIQKKFGVERFAEVPDSQLPVLHADATRLWDELSKAPVAADAGPFWFSNPFDDEDDE